MRVLVAFESSGQVRQAFRDRGHNAWSCDLLPADDGSPYHLQLDAAEAITMPNIDGRDWDLIIMHPPCTALCVSGNAHYGTGKPKHQKRVEAIAYTMELFEKAKHCAAMVCMENPVGVLPIKASQYVQPFEFGHAESKKTGLWLHNLPKLAPTEVISKPPCGHWDNQTPSGQNKLGPSADRWKIRSKTYSGIAEAMADQWGKL
jgi:site-specific DNA-cytosine methylase